MTNARVIPFPVNGEQSEDVRAYRAHMIAQHFTEDTVKHRSSFAARLLRRWGTWDVSTDQIRAFLAAYPNANTRFTYYGHFHALYEWLVASSRLLTSPVDPIKAPHKPGPNPRPLSRADARRSIEEAEGDIRAYLMLGRLAGLRAFEIAKFSGEHIDADHVYVLGKGGREAVVPTHPDLWVLAQSYPRQGLWFPSPRLPQTPIHRHTVTMRISRHFAGLGIAGASHRNRHFYGTELLRAGANVRVVQELMRHADLVTTVRYLGVDEDEKVAAIRLLSA